MITHQTILALLQKLVYAFGVAAGGSGFFGAIFEGKHELFECIIFDGFDASGIDQKRAVDTEKVEWLEFFFHAFESIKSSFFTTVKLIGGCNSVFERKALSLKEIITPICKLLNLNWLIGSFYVTWRSLFTQTQR